MVLIQWVDDLSITIGQVFMNQKLMIILLLLILADCLILFAGSSEYGLDCIDLSSTYNWVCFPRLDVKDGFNSGQYDDYLHPDQLLDDGWDTMPENISLFDSFHKGPYPHYSVSGINMEGDLDWEPAMYQIYSYKGMKISQSGKITVSGFQMNADYIFDPLIPYTENWLGYFLEESQHPIDAIPEDIMAYILEIKTQYWSINRATVTQNWDIDERYSFNYGDMVIIVPVLEVDDFHWIQSAKYQAGTQLEKAQHFAWEEEIDYIPIYIEFDQSDIPEEIAVYVNGKCDGAQVVIEQNCQICAYILGEKLEQEVNFAFYKEDEIIFKNQYLVLDMLSGKPCSNKIITGGSSKYFQVSFRKDISLPLRLKYDVQVNDEERAICFELDDESEISLNVYNIKGQLVRNLVNETYRPGEYQVVWDGHDSLGNVSSSGVYFYQMQCGSDVINGKMLMLK
jgi:flagellar hook capping protein FlgD